MSTEQLPDGLQLAVNELLKLAESNRRMGPLDQGSFFDRRALAMSASADAIRAEHAQRVTLQRHACDLAQRVADLEAERANTAAHVASIARQLGDEALQVDDIAVRVLGLVAERDELRARLAEIEAQEPVVWAPSCANQEFAASVRGDGDMLTVWFDRPAPGSTLRGACQTPLYARPVTAQAVPDGWRSLLEEAVKTIDSLPGYPAGAGLCDRIEAALAAAPEHKA